MSDPFYRAFEDRYRGTRELIRSRLEVYLPFVEPLRTLQDRPRALDLGCGRGEWLELMRGQGFQAEGVDLDEGMLSACRGLGLDVVQADALDHMGTLAADSLSVVSAFHVVEHISFAALRRLVDEAHRVLEPGGLLILEAPNSENLAVGTSSFYLDPTHQRPLPALLLSFVVEFGGFGRAKTLYLQESPHLATAPQIGLLSVLEGPSPDYAVIAQKKAAAEVLARFDAPFARSYGVRLGALAERYDRQAEARATRAEALAAQADARATRAAASAAQAEVRARQAEASAAQAEVRARHAEASAAQAEVRAARAEAGARQLAAQLQGVLASRSWRLTAPLRWSSSRLVAATASAATGARDWLRRRPRLHSRIATLLRRWPALYWSLRHLAEREDARSGIVQSESRIDELMRRVLQEAGKTGP